MDPVLENILIIGTFLAIMAFFCLSVCLSAFAVAAYSASRISHIDEGCTQLLGHDVDATIGIMHAKRSLQDARTAIGGMLLSWGASLNPSAKEELVKSAARFAVNAALKESWKES